MIGTEPSSLEVQPPLLRAPLLVLGLGNELLKDDAVGIRVAERLQGALPEQFEVGSTSLFGLALLDELIGRERVLLIDSYVPEDFAAAEVREFTFEDTGEACAPCPHFVGLREICAVMRRLELPFPHEVRILAIPTIDTTSFSTEMTPEVAGIVEKAVARARRIALEWASNPA